MRNTVLQSAAQGVMTTPTSTYFRISIEFSNASAGSTYFFTPFTIQKLTFDQDFTGNIFDSILATILVSPKDYALLQDQGQNIQARVVMTYVDQQGNTDLTITPVVKKYCVMITDPRDIRTAIPDVHLYTTPSYTLTVRLIEPTAYQMRHTKLNVCLHSATMSDTIHALLDGFGIAQLELIPPDNTHTYDHVQIPSYIDYSGIFSFLQSRYGVYEKGICYYLHDGISYIYPPFETSPTSLRTLTFFQVRTGMLGDAAYVHKKVGTDYQIVIDSQPHAYDLSTVGAENHGTGFTFTRASKTTDGFSTIDAGQGTIYTQDPSLAVGLNNPRTLINGLHNPKHVLTTDNPYPHMSVLASHQASLMEVTWPYADPFAAIPNNKVTYCYDDSGKMVKKSGIIDHAHFEITPIKQDGNRQLFRATGTLVLRLEPNVSKVLNSTSATPLNT